MREYNSKKKKTHDFKERPSASSVRCLQLSQTDRWFTGSWSVESSLLGPSCGAPVPTQKYVYPPSPPISASWVGEYLRARSSTLKSCEEMIKRDILKTYSTLSRLVQRIVCPRETHRLVPFMAPQDCRETRRLSTDPTPIICERGVIGLKAVSGSTISQSPEQRSELLGQSCGREQFVRRHETPIDS